MIKQGKVYCQLWVFKVISQKWFSTVRNFLFNVILWPQVNLPCEGIEETIYNSLTEQSSESLTAFKSVPLLRIALPMASFESYFLFQPFPCRMSKRSLGQIDLLLTGTWWLLQGSSCIHQKTRQKRTKRLVSVFVFVLKLLFHRHSPSLAIFKWQRDKHLL